MAKLKESYANALLELSEEKGTLEKDLAQAVWVIETINKQDVQFFLEHPHVSDSAKHEFFNNVFSDKLSKNLMGFLYLMVRNNRESLIIPVLSEFADRVNKRLGKVTAKVVSAKPLTEKQIESVRTLLSMKLSKEVEIKADVDPDVIGGFYILVDGRIFDRTVRTDLNNMTERLKRGVMNVS